MPMKTSGGDFVAASETGQHKKHCAISIMELTVIIFLPVCVFMLLYVCLGVNGVCESQVGIVFSLVVEYLNVLKPTRPLNLLTVQNVHYSYNYMYIYIYDTIFMFLSTMS